MSVTRLGVAGWPVGHSRSPLMQNAALHAVGLGERWHYQHLPIPPALFGDTALALSASGFRGINVTLPHKPAALALADRASDRARISGAANTLVFEQDGSISADNTDAVALGLALDGRLDGASVLVLGAGGSARGAVWALLDAGAAEVRVWNRTFERAQALCAEVGGEAVAQITAADVIVNCTSVGLGPGDTLQLLPLDAELVANAAVVVDFVYRGEAITPLGACALAQGTDFIDGLELLVLQGAAAFELFTGVSAPVDVMRTAVRS